MNMAILCERCRQKVLDTLTNHQCSNSQLKRGLGIVLGVGVVCFLILSLPVELPSLTRHLPPALASLTLSLFPAAARGPLTGQARHHHPRGEKMLIYVCRGSQGCAGWSDRQRSIVGMFLLALVTNRTFGILLTTPCDLSHFYRPNRYDWRVEESEVESRSPRLIYPADNLSRIDFNRQYPEDVLYARVNSECFGSITSNPLFKPLLPAWAKQPYGKYFHHGWHTLMKPTARVQQRLQHFLHSVNYFHNSSKPLVGVHLRMGRNPSNPYEKKVFIQTSQLEPVWQKVEPFVRNGSQVFVASDCEEVRNISRQRFGERHHDTGGVILHVGKQRGDARACQGFEDAILDQLILSYCGILFRSRGGFSLRASYMNRPVLKMFTINKGKVTP